MAVGSGFILAAAEEAGLRTPSIVLARVAPAAGPAAAVAPFAPLSPASMIKVPIAAALAAAVAAGRHRLEDPVRVDAANMTPNDAPSPFVTGFETTLATAAVAMLAASDNVATNVLIDVLGRERISATVRDEFGLGQTVVRRKLSGALPLIRDPGAAGRNEHPAGDAATLFAVIERERTARFGWLYDALTAQIWNGKLSQALAPGDAFAHKTGDTDEVSHDGGILTLADGRRFILVVYTGLAGSPESDARLAAFGRTLRDALAEQA